jgi:hypothetical protein
MILILGTENLKRFIEVLDELELLIDKKVIFDEKNFVDLFFLSTETFFGLNLSPIFFRVSGRISAGSTYKNFSLLYTFKILNILFLEKFSF